MVRTIAPKKIRVTPVFDRISLFTKPLRVVYGGAGSSKSMSVCQKLIQYGTMTTGKEIAISRKFFPSLRTTSMKLFFDQLETYGYYDKRCHDMTNNIYELNGNAYYFLSMGEGESGQQKIKSMNLNQVWLEEADEFTEYELLQFQLRLRNPPDEFMSNAIWMTLNPVDENCWIAQSLVFPAERGERNDVDFDKSTFKDNPFLPKEYIHLITETAKRNPNYYRVYVLAEWGRLDDLVYPIFNIVDKPPEKYIAWGYGIDWGDASPTAIVRIYITDEGTTWQECVYQTGLTTADVIERLNHLPRGPIWADPDGDRLSQVRRAGFDIFPAQKGTGSVTKGISICKERPISITADSTNGIKETRGYCNQVDRKGEKSDNPVKGNDHFLDAARYGTVGLKTWYGYPTDMRDYNETEWDYLEIG